MKKSKKKRAHESSISEPASTINKIAKIKDKATASRFKKESRKERKKTDEATDRKSSQRIGKMNDETTANRYENEKKKKEKNISEAEDDRLSKRICKTEDKTLPAKKIKMNISKDNKILPVNRLKVRTSFYDAFVMESIDDRQIFSDVKMKLIEKFIENTEERMYTIFDKQLKYTVAHRRALNMLKSSTFREKILNESINSTQFVEFLAKKNNSHVPLKNNPTKISKPMMKQNSILQKKFNPLDLLELPNLSRENSFIKVLESARNSAATATANESSLHLRHHDISHGQLVMAPFPTYKMPDDIRALVRGQPCAPDFTDLVLKLAPTRARSKTESYILSFTTKLFLEEDDELYKNFDRFNLDGVEIEHITNDKFRFQIKVSSTRMLAKIYTII